MGVRLPSEYQEVEYIEGTGTQWIDTGIIPHTNTKAQIKVMNLRVTGDVIFGYYEDGDTTDWRLFNYTSEVYFDLPQAGGSYGMRIIGRGASFKPNIVKELEIGNFYVKDLTNDSVIAQADAFEYVGNYSITLNAYGSENRRISKNRWYYVKIYDGNDIVFNGISCYRKSDSKTGMYDLVTKQFFANQGTGEFLVGHDIIGSISPMMVAWRRIMMAAASKNVEKWLGLSRVEVTVPERLTNAAQVYEFIVQHVPTDAWYWMACVEADFTVTPSTNNQLIIMCGIAGQTGAGSFIRFRDGAYNQNTSVSYNSTVYDLVLLPDTKISIFYNTGNDLTGGTVSIPNSSLSINVTRIQNEIENAAQLKSLLNGIHSGIISSVLNVDHADTSNYTANYNYMLSNLISANSGTFMRWVNGNPNGQSIWASGYGTVLHQNDVIVSIF